MNNMDRYGFSWILARYLGRRRPLRSFCDWVHWWVWFEDELTAMDLIGPKFKQLPYPLILANETQRQLASDWGYRNLAVGGLPICYVPPTGVVRNTSSLVGFLQHSTEEEKCAVEDARFLDFLADCRSNYEYVAVCVYSLDQTEALSMQIRRRGLLEIIGADPTDANSMIRQRQIFEHFGHVIGNCLGSYIAYAFHFGANVTLFSPFSEKDASTYLGTSQQYTKAQADRLAYISSEIYARKRFPLLFEEPARQENADSKYGAELVSQRYMMPPAQVLEAIGWSPWQQVRGYSRGALRRLSRIAEIS
jgi:hypothetical protein